MHRILLLLLASLVAVNSGAIPLVGPSRYPLAVSPQSHEKVNQIFQNMLARWQALDAACNPNAVFALTYIYMTYGVRTFLANSYFDDGNAMADLTVHFARRYIDAYDSYAAGNYSDVSGPWMRAFNWAASGHSNATENLLLGMNAHINYDLAISSYEQQYYLLTRKNDFDRINDLLAWVMNNVSIDLGERYDPTLTPGPTNDIVLPIVIAWRENAWATCFLYALTPLTNLLQFLSELSTTAATLVYQPLRSTNTTADRNAFCVAHHCPSKLN